MNMQKKLAVLIQLRQAVRRASANPTRQAARLAYAHAKQAVSSDDLYDLMGRLIILEGAAGVPEFSWSRNPMRGVRKAQQHFEEHLDNMDPKWFQTTSTGVLKMLIKSLDGWLGRSGVPTMSGEDIVQDGLAGIGALIDEDGKITHRKIKNKFWEAGNHKASGILAGVESPGKIAAGTLGRILKKAALNAITKLRRHQKTQGVSLKVSPEHTRLLQVEDGTTSNAVFDLIFFSNDPLGKAARQAIKRIIETKVSKGARHTMLTWWEALNKGDFLTGLELARAAGYLGDGVRENTAKVKVKKHWMSAMPIIFRGMQDNQQLQQAISTKLEARGVPVSNITWGDIMSEPKQFGRFVKYGALRRATLKLATQVPELRAHLIPILRP